MSRKYKDYSPAARLRIQAGNILSPFAHQDLLFYSDQLRTLLMAVFKFKDYEVSVELMEILAFGKNKYRNLQLEQLVSYFLEKHAGEKTLAKFQKVKKFKQPQRMDRQEFLKTVCLAFNFIEDVNSSELEQVFDEISKGETSIQHKEYCQFLKQFFGSESPMVLNPTQNAIQLQSQEIFAQELRESSENLQSGQFEKTQTPQSQQQPQERERLSFRSQTMALVQLRDLMVSQIRFKCSQLDGDYDEKLNRQQTFTFFYQILLLQKHSIDYILENYFRFTQAATASYAEIIEVIGEVHYREIFYSLLKQETGIENPNKIIMDGQYFNSKVSEACFFFRNRPSRDLLERVFKDLLARSELRDLGVVSLEDFRAFVLAFVCNKRLIFRQYSKKNTPTAANLPLSIAEVSNSNFEQDSQCNQVRPKEFQLSINDYKIQLNALGQRFDSQGHQSPNKLSGLNLYNRQGSNEIPAEKIVISQVSINEKEIKMKEAMKQRLSFIEHINGAFEPSNQLFTSLEQQEPKSEIVVRQEINVKQIILGDLSKTILKYSLNGQTITVNDVRQLVEKNFAFAKKFKNFSAKMAVFFAKNSQSPIKRFMSYVVHVLAEQALAEFNKTQIQGKFSLSEQQLSKLIYIAFGNFEGINSEACLVIARKFMEQCKRDKFTYTNWLLSVKKILAAY